MKALWDHPKSFFEINQQDRKLHIRGQLVLDGVECKFQLHEQGIYSEYRLRGSMSIISPKTGEVLEAVGEVRKEALGRRKDKDTPPKVQKTLLLNSLDKTEIKRYLEEAAQNLIAKNTAALEGSFSSISIDPSRHSLSELARRYCKNFLNERHLKSSTYRSRKSMLTRSAAVFGLTSLDKINVPTVEKHSRQLNDLQLALLSRFWEWCGYRCPLGDNPFAKFMHIHRKKRRDGRKTAQEKSTATNLFPEEENELNQKLLSLIIEDPRLIAIALAKDAGLGSTTMSTLKWSDILFDENETGLVRIKLVKETAGAVSDYTRPVFPFAAIALRQCYENLQKNHAKSEIANRYVVSVDGKKTKSTDISTIIRKGLKGLGISYNVLANLHAEDATVAAGTKLLINTYRYKLETQCGLLPSDPAAVRFLQALSLENDVSASHYRSFTSPEGQRKLYVAMRRFCSGLENHSSQHKKTEESIDGGYACTIAPMDKTKCAEISATFELEPGECLTLDSEYSIKGVVSVEVQGEPADEIETVQYYDLIWPHGA